MDDKVSNKSVTYVYDFVGNITAVKTYLYTTGALGSPLTTQSYTYNSQNRRTDLGYDASGNLTSLNGYTFTWSGRRLTAAVNANTDISYTYNHNGIRTSKTVNGTTTYYEVDENNNVVKQYELVNDAETNVIEFVYDSSNSPIYFTYNNATYYYEKNLQGDIVAILDSSGNTVVEYTYDIWGKSVSITGSLADTVGTINPLRYRGYYYDTETGLYYLQSRYYSPDLMRFISQDDPVFSNAQGEPLGSNLYVYCLNNPVMNIDTDGKIALVDDAVFWAFIGLCTTALMLTRWMSTPEFLRSWTSFCAALGNGLSWIGTSIINGGRAARNWTKARIKAATTAMTAFITLVKAVSKVQTRVKNARRNSYRFFEIWFDRIGTPIIGRALNREQAITRARRGLNSITYYASDAKYVANRAGGNRAMWHQRHGGLGYFNHYHIYAHRNSAHIYYLIAG